MAKVMEPNIEHIIKSDIKWIFVGGKGGVGKTTTSCALGMILARHRKSVLIISTDPAHNLSDSFDQKLSHKPTLIKGFENLYGMEIDAEAGLNGSESFMEGSPSFGEGVLKNLMGTLPGIDEAVSFSKVTELVDNMQYDIVIFDTAPTGHTLRLLSFPLALSETVGKFHELKTTLFPLMKQMAAFMGSDFNIEPFLTKIENAIPTIEKVSRLLMDANHTTFICVCIAEFLSMYETERLIQQLKGLKIDVNTLVINQLVKRDSECEKCNLCTSRANCQEEYIQQIEDMFENLHIVKAYLLPYEVRGLDHLEIYSKYLSQ